MKKLFLLVFITCMDLMVHGQAKMYEYNSNTFNEKTIEQLLEQSRKNGTPAWEVQMLKDHLYQRLEKMKNGTVQPSAQRGTPNQVMAACTNVDFEQGNYTGWTLTSGNVSGATLPCNTCPSLPGGIAAITTASNSGTTWTNGVDNCSGIPAVAPGGGNFSLCLNDNTAGYKIQKISQTFLVTSSNNIFTFQYLAVLEDGTHPPNWQPYFSVEMLDQNGNVIPCTQDLQSAAASALGWTNSIPCSGVIYKGWKTVTIDLTAYISQNVTIEYVVSDCTQGGHYGYAYIDGACGQINYTNNASICSGASAQLCGPPGYATYSWAGSVTGSTQCITTGSVGTYTLTTTSSLGCPSPVLTYTVNANPAATPNFSVATSPCSLTAIFTDQSTVSSGTISNWSWNFGDGQTATSTTAGNVQNHTYSTGGSYVVTMTCTTAAGCASTFSATVNVQANLNTNIFTTAVTCNGASTGSATLSPVGGSGSYTYTWTPNVSTTSTAGGLGAGNYTVNINDGAGCNTTTVVAISQPAPVTASTSFTASTCGQGNGSANATATGGTGPYTYTWSPSGGNNSTAAGVPAGNYTCNITDSKGCLGAAQITVGNTAGPSASITASSSVTCNGGTNGSATASGTGGSGTLSYSWSPQGGTNTTANNLPAGTYTCIVTDANGCPTNTVVTISQPSAINPTTSFTSTACGSSNGSANVNVTGGTGPYTYSWSPTGGTGTTASNLGAGSYSCTVTDANGCVKVAQVVITTSTGPTATITASSSVTCNGGSDGSAAVSASGGAGSFTYTWSPVGGNNTSATNLPAGNYNVIIVDANGCVASQNITIAQPSAITTTITAANVNCNAGSNGSASVNATGGTGALTYSWSPIGGNTSTVSGLPAGSYTCTITDTHGCVTTTVAAITEPTPINLTVTSNNVLCNGGTNGSASVNTSGGVGPYTYTWTPVGGNSNSATGLGVGSYTCYVTDFHGCLSNTVTAIAQPAAMSSVSNGTNILCNGLTNGSATVTPSGGSGPYTYSWIPTGGSGVAASNLPVGNYTCTVTDVNGCTTKSTVAITQPPAIAGTSSVTPALCSGAGTASASVTVSGGVSPYTITWSTNPVQTGTSATGLSEGSYTIIVTDANGCVKKKPFAVSDPAPKDSLKMMGTLCSSDPNVLLIAPQGGVSPNVIGGPYQWYASLTPLAGANASTYTANSGAVNSYAVTWFYHGCRYITRTVVETIYADISTLPQANIFTPNEDRINDDFLPFALGNVSANYLQQVSTVIDSYELFIYDRWGILMFHSADITKTWDGQKAPDGTYYWIAKYKTKCNATSREQNIKGFVQLIR